VDQDGLTGEMEILISKLIEIGKASRPESPAVRNLVVEAQDCALQMHREMVRLLHENEQLRVSNSSLPANKLR
jgi:hypothetical protein